MTTTVQDELLTDVSGKLIDVQVFDRVTYPAGSATWTKPSGCTQVKVTVIGGGAGGGGADAANNTSPTGAGGGGAGAYEECIITSGLGTSESITIGEFGAGGSTAGGNGVDGTSSSFGSFVTCGGGSGGIGTGVFSGSADFNTGGNGGTSTTSGVVTLHSVELSQGHDGIGFTTGGTNYVFLPGVGGSTPKGMGGAAGIGQNGFSNGTAGLGNGAGGGGGGTSQTNGRVGGDGSHGIVIVESYT